MTVSVSGIARVWHETVWRRATRGHTLDRSDGVGGRVDLLAARMVRGLMPSLEWNRDTWENYAWAEGGDEWSGPWSGTAAQWYGSLLPRVHHWVPAEAI